ncbi:serine/threonine-protein kinase [Streptomyces sp. TLI_171]|uniref:serine/threonine-protein kinase n=1 Tax=Streptomyces sp. TLI_171 TaxID=1938859 RepID=UPI000C17BA46|nr:serine/threonine-protein kinase [Streptomyces sp. TLI_171]RKE17388.1 serine/threonine protein kinase [Streptomyces sp. TLI_171]
MTIGGPGGRLIDGRFELLARLGGGGMGLVWRARDTLLQREVALKEVRPPDPAMLAADPAAAFELRERVLREAQALARLQHPNVVIIHHIVDNAELPHPWLVMELVSGGSLHDRILRGALPPQEAARIGRGVLSALRAAHAAGIQHRDVKPANVLIRADGTPVLTDFGIAALSETPSLTATGALIGSPEFIAPERIRGHEGNPASDLWSLGMMLYVAVEGHHPLRRASTIATLAAVLDEPLPPPLRCGPLGPTLTALLARDPAARPDADRLDRLFAAAEQGIDGTLGGGSPFSPTQTNDAFPYAATPTPTPVPPGGGHPYAPTQLNGALPYPTGPTDQVPGVGPRPARRRTGAVIAAAVAGTAAIGLLAWSLQNGMLDPGTRALGSGSTPQTVHSATGGAAPASAGATASATVGSSPKAVPTLAANKDLLTPDGARGLADAIRSATGSGTVIELRIYPEYAGADVVTKENPKHYDDVSYRGGKITSQPGGTITSQKPVDLSKIDWNQIPDVMEKAKTALGVPNPKSRYLLVDYGWFADEITIRYYLSDDYNGGGYVTAGATGKVLKVVKSG